MTDKTQAALLRVLKTFEYMNHEDSIFNGEFDEEVAAIREALADHFPDATKMMEPPAQPYKGIADHIHQSTNGAARIDPVTGDFGIGTPPEQPAIKFTDKMSIDVPDQPLFQKQPAQQEPFGYFKAEPFGWTDCAETDEGAIALYERPQPAQEPWPEEPAGHMPGRVQPAQHQEPVAVARVDDLERGGRVRALAMNLSLDAPLYTSPQSKPLTDEEIEEVWRRVEANDFHDCVQPFARAIEAAHGITGEQK